MINILQYLPSFLSCLHIIFNSLKNTISFPSHFTLLSSKTQQYKSNKQMQKQWSVSSKSNCTPVYLNIYSFCHCCNVTCGWIGLGLYHTAIQIFGIQYMFHGWGGDQTGVTEVIPKTCPYRFEQQVLLGYIEYSFSQLDYQIVEPLRRQFISNRYDLLNNNCNHFALAMSQKLNMSQSHPKSYIFRLTNCANTFRCCLPRCILSGKLDWFTNKDKENEQLQQIRNSQMKYTEISGRTVISALDTPNQMRIFSSPDSSPDRQSLKKEKTSYIQQRISYPLNQQYSHDR